jgi:hypothetical protein
MTTIEPSRLWRPALRPEPLSTAVLVPGPLGALEVHVRRPGRPLEAVATVTDARTLHEALRDLWPPGVAILCGRRHADDVLEHVLEHADLYVVPAHWLAAAPRDDPRARAALAARLVAAHRRHPIERYYCDDYLAPF